MQELQVKHLKINTYLRFFSTFSDDLMTEIWQCENGHLVCENCFDKETFEERKNLSLQEKCSSLKSSVTSQSDLFSRRRVFDTRTDTTLSEKTSCLEIGSYIRPKIDKIDFFEYTLNIRKDAMLSLMKKKMARRALYLVTNWTMLKKRQFSTTNS